MREILQKLSIFGKLRISPNGKCLNGKCLNGKCTDVFLLLQRGKRIFEDSEPQAKVRRVDTPHPRTGLRTIPEAPTSSTRPQGLRTIPEGSIIQYFPRNLEVAN